MNIDQIKEARDARPFKPFTLSLADGRRLGVPHPEYLSFPPAWSRSLIVAQPSGSVSVVNALLVVSLDFDEGKDGKARRGRKSA